MRSLLIVVCLMLLVCVSCAPPAPPTPTNPTTPRRLPNGRFATAPVVAPMRTFRRNEAATNLATKNQGKADQKAAAPEQQRISEQNRVNDIAKTLQRGNKQQTAKQIFDIQEQRRVKIDQITKINKIIESRDPAKLIPVSENPATAVKMNQLDQMNQADRLSKTMTGFDGLVTQQKADIARLKQLNDYGIKGNQGKEWLTTEARTVQSRENERMAKIRNFLQGENDVLDRQAKALSQTTNNHNSPLQEASLDEADFDEAEVNESELDEAELNEAEVDEASVEDESNFDFDGAKEVSIPVTPKQMFHHRRNQHNKVHVNVKVDA